MRSGEQISPTFCYRGAGWYKQIWEGILEKPVEKVEMLQSVCQGDDVCEFAIRLPIGDAPGL
jgi:predicted hydrocarbon binding protein